MTTTSNAEAFRNFVIEKINHDPGVIRLTQPRKPIRFSTSADPHDRTGAYYFTGKTGKVCNFRDPEQIWHKWKTSEELSQEDEAELIQNAKNEKAINKANATLAALKAREDYAKLNPLYRANEAHPYLERKNIKPFGILQDKGVLMIPLYDSKREHVNTQRIFPNGDKKGYLNAVYEDVHYIFGEIVDKFIIVEGFATGATLHEVTGWPVVMACTAGNLVGVSKYFRKFYPNAEIIIAADDDVSPTSNRAGERAAREAAKSTNAKISLPPFDRSKDPSDKTCSDWNDYARIYGKETVRDKFFDCAKPLSPASDGGLPAVISEINQTYFVSKNKGKFVIMEERPDIGEGPELWQHSLQDFTLTFCDRKVEVNGRSVELGQYWIHHPGRRKYFGGVSFNPRPNVPEDVYNLYTGLGVEPSDEGSWELLRKHTLKIVCSNNSEHFEYLMNWMARALQYPWLMGETIVVMKGVEGSGKGLLANSLLHIFGRHAMPIQDEEQFTGKFNDHLCDKIFIFIDEAFFAGGKKHISKLKVMATEKTLTYEPKGRPAYTGPNYLHMMMASNEDWVVPASVNDRRYFVLEVKPDKANDQSYFEPIRKQLSSGGYEAMAYELLNRDISNYNPRKIPFTNALFEQKELSLSIFNAWLYDILRRGYVYESDYGTEAMATWHELFSTALTYKSFLSYARARGVRQPPADNTFGKSLKALLGKDTKKATKIIIAERRDSDGRGEAVLSVNQTRVYVFGQLTDLRKTFAQKVLKRPEFQWELADAQKEEDQGKQEEFDYAPADETPDDDFPF